MAITPYPLPRETRESAVLVGNGTVGPYGPSAYKIFDTADVKVFAKVLGATVYSDVTANCTIAKVNPASAYDYFTVTFNALVLATTSWKHQARRTAERSVAVTKAGTLVAAELEKELSKQASAQSELRRDVDHAYAAQQGALAGVIIPGAAGDLMMSDATGNMVGSGENVTTILGSTATAVAAAGAASASATTAAESATAAATSATNAGNSAVAAAASAASALANVPVAIHAASAKATLVDADELGVADSAALFALKKWTWANLKANIIAYFNSVNDGSPLDADRVWTGDSANSFTPIYSTWTQIKAFLKTYFDTLYPSLDVVVETPQGRVTLTTLTAITATDVAGATTIYYTPAAGNIVPIWNGTRFINTPFTELSLALDPTGAHTGYHQSGKIFDLFVINDSGTLRFVTGPAWASDTSRGTGAGTTERQLLNGIWVNKNALAASRWGSASGNTVAVSANQATYVGNFCASADGQASDTLLKRHLNNAYNKVTRPMARVDGSTGVVYSTFAYRQANANAANQLDFLSGDDGQYVEADTAAAAINSTATRRLVYGGIGLDSTTVNTATLADSVGVDNTTYCMVTAKWRGYPGLGRHKLVWLEAGAGADAQTWSYAGAVPSLGMSGWVMG